MRKWYPVVFLSACFSPAGLRLVSQGLTEPLGLLSDICVGLLFAVSAWQPSRFLRIGFVSFWFLFQVGSRELLSAVQRMPSWQDLAFVMDPAFLTNTAAGFYFAEPGFALGLGILSIAAVALPLQRPGKKPLAALLLAGLLILPIHVLLQKMVKDRGIAETYNSLHWFAGDAIQSLLPKGDQPLSPDALPMTLRTADVGGAPFFEQGRAKNVLLIVLEGISGIYLPEIRQAMQVKDGPFTMVKLSDATRNAMLIPDFVTHSHQTIRGLYSIHCGDFSKFSYDQPKALELQFNPERAIQCLPAQLSAEGFDTHFLQGAPLQFMSKDRIMPVMGFERVSGVEWFTKRTRTDFVWGATDEDFFTGAGRYIRSLKSSGKPWFLSLLTVGTHQPFDADDEGEARYGSRKIASVARLDQALGRFMKELKQSRVLENTLVIITSDESHGAEEEDWFSSWGFAAVLAPEQQSLPRLKTGTYGLVDIEVSILDYLGFPLPPDIVGRSFFRDYPESRDMVSYTAGKLRRQTPEHLLYECAGEGDCTVSRNSGIIGPRQESEPVDDKTSEYVYAVARALDEKLAHVDPIMVLRFADGETRALPEKVMNEWTDNLIGAQYLSFPKNSKVRVDIRLRAVAAGPEGIQPKLTLREFEHEVISIPYPSFPLMREGEEARIQFDFTNKKERNAFSFHLTAEGRDASIRFEKFEVVIERGR
jgi:hypothetical protein